MKNILFLLLTTYTISFAQRLTPINDCRKLPAYFAKTGIDLKSNFGFSVNEKDRIGLSLVQFKTELFPYKLYFHPSWDSAGYLGAVVTDNFGNAYVIQRPFINTLKNTPLSQNIIYRIESQTGLLTPFFKLFAPPKAIGINPFGLLGIIFDCEAETLIASSVYCSEADKEKGKIYFIKIKNNTPELIDSISDFDVYGLGIGRIGGDKYLFMGSGRNSSLYKIKISANGNIVGAPEYVLSIAGLGNRGDDKIRKIKIENNIIRISGSTFNFNLANVAKNTEYIYSFYYNSNPKETKLISISEGIQ